MDDKYPNALMGDAYIGKSEKNYIIAEQYYNKYPDIAKYESRLRKKFLKIEKERRKRNLIQSLIILILISLIAYFWFL